MKPIRVALVDDNPSFLNVVKSFLGELPEVEVVGDGTKGSLVPDRVETVKPEIVLLDLNLPDMPGLEVLPQLRQAAPALGIVVLTLLEPEVYRGPAMEAGADEFVWKPQLVTELLPAIKRAAAKHGPDAAPGAQEASG